MKRIGLMIAFFAVLAILVPLAAQDAKKDPDKTEKKDPDKKDKPKKEKLVYGAKFITKIVNMKGDTNREYTIEIHEKDPKKVYDMNLWSAQRQQQLAQQYASAIQQKDGGAALRNWMQATGQYQVQLAQRATQIYSTRTIDVRAAEHAKVRSMVLPIEFDDQGFQKKWTKKEIEARKDKNGMPGYFPSEFDAVKQGQYVEMYMAKVAPMKKGKKKGPDDDDPATAKSKVAEFVLIVILPEAKK